MGILAGTAPGWVIAPLLLLWLAVSGTSKSSVPSPLLLRGASQVVTRVTGEQNES